jgi:RNA polymerase sigma factor (sigma-70 family)
VQQFRSSTNHRRSHNGRQPHMASFQLDVANWDALAHEVRRVARHWHLNPEDVDDVVQETLLRLFEHGPAVQSVPGWIGVVVRRLAHTLAQRRSKETILPPRLLGTSDGFDLTSQLALSEILTKVPPKDRNLLHLIARGYSHREIAQHMGWQTRDVGTKLDRAVRKAARLLAPT